MTTIKVYKTDVDDHSKAETILDEIRRNQPGSDPSFDLEDCDKVLRVENNVSGVNETELKKIIENHGYRMEVLP